MKTRIFLMLIMAAALLFSCQKEKNEPVAGEQEVSFSATLIQPDLKNSEDYIPCSNLVPTHAHIVIAGTPPLVFDIQVYTIGTKLYTQAIKLPAGNYQVTTFFLYYEGNAIAGYQTTPAGDVIVYGTPESGNYVQYLTHPLPYSFTVAAWSKLELDIEVLCFQDLLYQQFGFFWFDITQIIIREQCFFGDFCMKHVEEYIGSSYWQQPGHPATGFYDAPAIIELIVEQQIGASWIPVHGSPFTNNFGPNYGVGAPVCIEYPDVVGVVDNFRVTLKVLVKDGDAFNFIIFHTWLFQDGQMIVPPSPPGPGDGIVDFVVGSCNLIPADITFPPYQNLPDYATVQFTHPAIPGYWGVKVTSVTPAAPLGGYDLPVNVNMAGWCGDQFHFINAGTHNDILIYGTLTDAGWPTGMPWGIGKIAQVNWLFNNLANWGMSMTGMTDAQGDDVQDAIWGILQGKTGLSTTAQAMVNQAALHSNYIPLPGGWAAVLMIKDGEPKLYQLIFTIVDP